MTWKPAGRPALAARTGHTRTARAEIEALIEVAAAARQEQAHGQEAPDRRSSGAERGRPDLRYSAPLSLVTRGGRRGQDLGAN